jgi:hypothetical protein
MVFLHSPGDYSNIAVSPEFQIDEHRSKTTGSAQSGDLLTRENVTARRSDSGSYYLLDVSFAVPDVPDSKFDTICGFMVCNNWKTAVTRYGLSIGSWILATEGACGVLRSRAEGVRRSVARLELNILRRFDCRRLLSEP